jgi:hypothetical protein
MRKGTGSAPAPAEFARWVLFVGLLALGLFNLTLNPDFVPGARADFGTVDACADGTTAYACPDPYSDLSTTVCVPDDEDPPTCDCTPTDVPASEPIDTGVDTTTVSIP